MTNTRIVQIGLVGLAILTGLFLEHVFLVGFGAWSVTQPLTRPLWNDWTWSSFIGLAIAGGAALYIWMTPKLRDVALDIVAELRKVSWPGIPETRAATVAVIVASIIAAALLGLFDVCWQFLTDKIQNPSL
jgi:preprotein translocase subunit SecE